MSRRCHITRRARLFDYLVAAFVLLCVCRCVALYGPSDMQAIADTAADKNDAQEQAAREFRQEVRLAKRCRELHGESFLRWTAQGEPVCVPRHGHKVSAI